MQTSPLPGPQQTVAKALPLVITDYLSTFRDAVSFQQLLPEPKNADPKALLRTLLPSFYTFAEEAKTTELFPSNSELASVLPRLRSIAQDTDAALQASNSALKERGLEGIAARLEALPTQLPALGLRSDAIQRWTAVIHRWQRIVEYELSEQKKVSQGELLNPFQYGNPLRRNRTDLFKGRQSFAENIARILLDRNRPTIILHGPRRCGKTSFLYNLPRLLPSQWIPIFC